MEWEQAAALIVGSSVIAAIVSQVLPVALSRKRLKVEQEFEDERRRKDIEAERRTRNQAAHFAAASRLAEDVAKIYVDLDKIASQFGPEFDFYRPEGIPNSGDERDLANDAIARLRLVWTTHPTSQVRDKAHQLYARLISSYGEIRPSGLALFPSAAGDLDEVLDQLKDAEKLVELLHSPPGP